MKITVYLQSGGPRFEVELEGFPVVGDHIFFPLLDYEDNPPPWVTYTSRDVYSDHLGGKIMHVEERGWWPEPTIWIKKRTLK